MGGAAAKDQLASGPSRLGSRRDSDRAPRACRCQPGRLFRYPGLKEDYYLADFEPDPAIFAELKIERDSILAVVRPPA